MLDRLFFLIFISFGLCMILVTQTAILLSFLAIPILIFRLISFLNNL